jgi:hypothetical protein
MVLFLTVTLSIRAFCHRQLGMQYTDHGEAFATLNKSYLDYLAAADAYPVDDESHACEDLEIVLTSNRTEHP